MDIKKVFGSFFSLLGTAAIIYAAFIFLNTNMKDWVEALVVFAVGVIFFSSGIGLLKRLD